MLSDYFAWPAEPVKLCEPERYSMLCCAPIFLDTKQGCYVCTGCGLVRNSKYIVQEEEPVYYDIGQPFGSKGCYGGNSKHRPYKPITHFREHIKRYLGQRFTEIPETLLDDVRGCFDLGDRDAYSKVKQRLKSLRGKEYRVLVWDRQMRRYTPRYNRSTCYYKDIFQIIYALGGVQPPLEHIEELERVFIGVSYNFHLLAKQCRTTRRNIPSYYMILDYILKMNGTPSQYDLPVLKNDTLCSKARYLLDRIFAETCG